VRYCAWETGGHDDWRKGRQPPRAHPKALLKEAIARTPGTAVTRHCRSSRASSVGACSRPWHLAHPRACRRRRVFGVWQSPAHSDALILLSVFVWPLCHAVGQTAQAQVAANFFGSAALCAHLACAALLRSALPSHDGQPVGAHLWHRTGMRGCVP